MYSFFSVLAFSLISLSSPYLASHDFSEGSSSPYLLAKDADFQQLKEHGKLFFKLEALQSTNLSGQWRAFVVTPDGRKFKGPKIDITSPSRAFTITVKPPILRGPYTIVVKNLSISGADPLSLTLQTVIVSNSFNNNSCIVDIPTFFPSATPGQSVEINFVPFTTDFSNSN